MAQSKLDSTIHEAMAHGDYKLIQKINTLRTVLNNAAYAELWKSYNEAALMLNHYGAQISLVHIPTPFDDGEYEQMGMFDAPKYLTGKEGFVEAGETFWLHNAKIDGYASVGGQSKEQAKLQVSKEKDGEKCIVYTSGGGIVNQVKRMDANDKAKFPIEIRLDQVPSRQGSPANVFTPAGQPAPTGADFAPISSEEF